MYAANGFHGTRLPFTVCRAPRFFLKKLSTKTIKQAYSVKERNKYAV
jgi:hypothetical protein